IGGISGTGTINDPVDSTIKSNGVSDATAIEGENLVHTITLNSKTLQPVNYAFDLSEGTATAGDDYENAPIFSENVNLSAGKITVPAGVISFTVSYPTKKDILDENSETTTLSIGGISGTGIINDPVDSTIKSNGVSDATAIEGENLVHTITLNSKTLQPVNYAFELSEGTATAGDDYENAPIFSENVNLSAGKITVPAGVISFTVSYPTKKDILDENSETTTLSIGGISGTGTINDPVDSTIKSNGVSDATAIEGENLVHTITLNSETLQPVNYAFELSEGTATAGDDYENAPIFSENVTLSAGKITVPAGVISFTVSYPTKKDILDENSETTTLSIG
ncbi:hypothetical protein LNJ05_13005, partial [Tenacibaculum finnmarkense genomovar ulcerans]|uniref:Calx-beta domain-containing protein n=1 Tax=Tenacibaculum finnmarkense TaxID=2781243 RepID=UPI001E5A455D